MLSPYFYVLLLFPVLISISVKSFVLGLKTCIPFHLRQVLSFSWMSGWTILKLWRRLLLKTCTATLLQQFPIVFIIQTQPCLKSATVVPAIWHSNCFSCTATLFTAVQQRQNADNIKNMSTFLFFVISLWDTYLSMHMLQDLVGSRSGISPVVVWLCSRSKATVPETVVQRI